MLLIKLLRPLKKLPTQPKISNLKYPIINQYILRFDISMYNIELIKILEGMQYLFEIPQYIFLPRQFPILMQFGKIRCEVFIIAVL